jgi:flagellar biosynthesis protein FlhG
MDQAHNLRSIMKGKNVTSEDGSKIEARVLTVTSGKGGVGKTNFTLNLAINLSLLGFRIVIIDADFGLANIEVLFGSIPRYSFADLLDGSKTIEEIVTEGPNGIKFISGGSGLSQLANISERQMLSIFESFSYIDTLADIIIIDTGAGISKSVVNFIKSSKECIVVTTPEPTSITDAYSILKTVKEQSKEVPEFQVVVNRCYEDEDGEEIFERLAKVTDKFLDIKLKFLGSLPYDKLLVKAVKIQEPVSIAYPTSDINRAIKEIANDLVGANKSKDKQQDSMKSFMKRLIGVFGS